MEYKLNPWGHQLEHIERSKDKPEYAYLFDPGAGKSGTVLNVLRYKMNTHKRLLKTLILCPSIVVANWKKEIELHTHIPLDKVVLLQGTGRNRVKLFEKFQKEGAIFVTNYEALNMPDLYEKFLSYWFEVFILDESHYLKNHKAKRTKLCEKLCVPKTHTPIFKAILSGTPILNSPLDIFSQYKILDGGKTFGSNYYAFMNMYFVNRNASSPSHVTWPDWQPRTKERDGFDALEDIKKRIYRKGGRVLKEDCMDLPPLITETISLEMTKEQKRIYEDLKDEFVAYLSEGRISTELAVTKGMRLLQISSGFVREDTGRDIEIKNNPKLKALGEILDCTPGKIIIWACFKNNYKQIRELLEKRKEDYVECHGEVGSSDKRQEAARRFNQRGKGPRIFLGNPASAGIGINLTEAQYAVYFSLGFGLGDFLQSKDRNYRGGSERHTSIMHYHLVMKDTVEEKVRQALIKKQEISGKVLAEIVSRM